jgi:hypothetical protein
MRFPGCIRNRNLRISRKSGSRVFKGACPRRLRGSDSCIVRSSHFRWPLHVLLPAK